MILEVNDAGEILVPAELVRAAPRTYLEAGRDGDSVVQKLISPARPEERRGIADSLPLLEGNITDPSLTFRREDLYGSDAR